MPLHLDNSYPPDPPYNLFLMLLRNPYLATWITCGETGYQDPYRAGYKSSMSAILDYWKSILLSFIKRSFWYRADAGYCAEGSSGFVGHLSEARFRLGVLSVSRCYRIDLIEIVWLSSTFIVIEITQFGCLLEKEKVDCLALVFYHSCGLLW